MPWKRTQFDMLLNDRTTTPHKGYQNTEAPHMIVYRHKKRATWALGATSPAGVGMICHGFPRLSSAKLAALEIEKLTDWNRDFTDGNFGGLTHAEHRALYEAITDVKHAAIAAT